MQQIILVQAIQLIAKIILGSGILDRVLHIVTVWADKEISGAEKRQGVLDQMEVVGLKLSKSAANLAVELAVQVLRRKTGGSL